MNQPAKPNKPVGRRGWLILPGLIGALLLLHVLFDIPGRFFYEDRGWDIPIDSQQNAAYNYAHSLKLPDSVPKPQPFNFPLARLKALVPGQSDVSTQYFNHLCSTESGEYIFKTVDNVEGVFQMRPRGKVANTPLDFDRYALEEPTGVGWSNDEGGDDQVYERYVQPMYGKYIFMERPNLDSLDAVIRAERNINAHPPAGETRGHQTSALMEQYFEYQFDLPWMITYQNVSQRKARYGFLWRGIKRELDRRYAIGAGEYLVVDMDTNEVLAVKRRFKLSGYDRNTNSHIWWSNARPCENEMVKRQGRNPSPTPITEFIQKVLTPVSNVNDQYIPKEIQERLLRRNRHE